MIDSVLEYAILHFIHTAMFGKGKNESLGVEIENERGKVTYPTSLAVRSKTQVL